MLGVIRASSPGGGDRREFLWPVDVLALLLLTWIGGYQKHSDDFIFDSQKITPGS
jgi:hypothetical protein